jgi:hypothetical protein
VYSAAYSAAYAVGPLFSNVGEIGHGSFCCAHVLDEERMQAAEFAIERVGGKSRFSVSVSLHSSGCRLFLRGWLRNADRITFHHT